MVQMCIERAHTVSYLKMRSVVMDGTMLRKNNLRCIVEKVCGEQRSYSACQIPSVIA